MKKRIIACLLAGMMSIATLAACGNSGDKTTTTTDAANDAVADGDAAPADADAQGETSQEASTGDKNIRAMLAASPESLDPHKQSALDAGNYIAHMYDGLYRYNVDGNGVEKALAKDVVVSEDGLTYTYTLEDNWLWSDGEPVTAQNFEYSWKRFVNPETASPYAIDMGSFLLNGADVAEGTKPVDELGVKAIDDHTLEVKLQTPVTFIEEIFAFPTFIPLRQDKIEEGGDLWAVDPATNIGNGAFQLSDYAMDEQMVVVRNDKYPLKDTIVPDQVTFVFMNDLNTALNAFQAGELDLVKEAPEEEVLRLKEEGVYHTYPALGTYYIDFNNTKEPFTNPLVRKAFTLALDPAYIAETTKNGTVLPATAFVGSGYSDATEGSEFRTVGGVLLDITDTETRFQAARDALAEAGYPNGEGFPAVEYMYNTGAAHEVIAEAIQQMWQEVLNVDVTISAQEWGVFGETRRLGGHQIARQGWLADYNDPSSLLNLFISTNADGGNNTAQYKNPEYDKLMNVAKTSTDQAERMQAMHDAEALLITQDYAVAPLYYYANNYLENPNLKGIGVAKTGFVMFQHASK